MKNVTRFAYIVCCTALCLCSCNLSTSDNNANPDDNASAAEPNTQQAEQPTKNKVTTLTTISVWMPITAKDGTTFERCLNANGCEFNGKRYLLGSQKKGEIVSCGEKEGFEFVQGYACQPLFSEKICISKSSCACGNTSIEPGEFCINDYYKSTYDKLLINRMPEEEKTNYNHNHIENYHPLHVDELENEGSCIEEKGYQCSDDEIKNLIQDQYGSQFSCIDIMTEDTKLVSDNKECSILHYTPIIYCNKRSGCKTPDGRIFSYLYHDVLEDKLNLNACTYYLNGQFDSTIETRCKTGDCVWPENYEFSSTETNFLAFTNDPKMIKKVGNKNTIVGFKQGAMPSWFDAYTVKQSGIAAVIKTRIPDTKKCEGGTLYCHGTQNAPVPIPEMREGFVCQTVSEGIKEWVCTLKNGCACGDTVTPYGAYCYSNMSMAGGVILLDSNDFKFESYKTIPQHKQAPVCYGKYCACGPQNCEVGAACDFGKCKCGNTDQVLDSKDGWVCKYHNIDNFETYREFCTNPEGCAYGDHKICPQNAYYASGDCYCNDSDPLPGTGFSCDSNKKEWLCTDEAGCGTIHGIAYQQNDYYKKIKCIAPASLETKGCMCDNHLMTEDAECLFSNSNNSNVPVCKNEAGCSLGNLNCHYGEYMISNKCIVPDSMDGEAAEAYWIEKVYQNAVRAKDCNEENCKCGGTMCKAGTFCLDGTCSYANIVFQRYGQIYKYEFSEDFEIDLRNDPKQAKKLIARMLYGDWAGCINGINAYPIEKVAMWNLTKSGGDSIENRYCAISHDCAEPSEYGPYSNLGNVVPFGLFIDSAAVDAHEDKKALCGQVVCNNNIDCECTTRFGKLSCGCANGNDIVISSDTTFSCDHTTVLKEDVNNYTCQVGLGFICQQEEGCKCGSKTCSQNAVCIAPDLCSLPLM